MKRAELLTLLLLLTLFSLAQKSVMLASGWQFKKATETDWRNAQVPGNVHADLLRNGMIADPYKGNNEKSLQWIGEADWDYAVKFDYDSVIMKNAMLVFDGLDTYADIFINGQPVMQGNNMFVQWKIPLTGAKLKTKGNELLVRFTSSLKKDAEAKAKFGIPLPGDYAFTRKAAYEYGWDWGPRFITTGIWKPVYITYESRINISNIRTKTLYITDTAAQLKTSFVLKGNIDAAYTLNISNGVSGETYYQSTNPAVHHAAGKSNSDTITFVYSIKNPKRWWCHGMGEPNLYNLHIYLYDATGLVILDTTQTIGLRTLELVQDKDVTGKTFYFRLNGVKVFCKGANVIPPSSFPGTVTSEDYKKIISDAVAVNMNMLRVWGGGFYFDDAFYRLCDENGIMIWQDLMFAGTAYPANNEFLEKVKPEIIQQAERLSHHPSMALWCGNNEVAEGWFNWGWQKKFEYAPKDSALLWIMNQTMFNNDIPSWIKSVNPQANYWPSSPAYGWGRKESLQTGDCHYWGVWWGKEPFTIYNDKTGRFMSEYGFQSMPSLKTIKEFMTNDSFTMASSEIRNHQKNTGGFETIDGYLSGYMKKNPSLEKYIFQTQWLQGEALKNAIEAHRRGKPYCMGTLYWQMNDCWPVTSWSTVDGAGRWKKSHYDLQKLYAPVQINTTLINGAMQIYAVSDSSAPFGAIMRIHIMDEKGATVYSFEQPVQVENKTATVLYELILSSVKNTDINKCVISISLFEGENLISSTWREIDMVKFIANLKPAMLSIEPYGGADENMIRIKNNGSYVKDICLSFDDIDPQFSENYFDLLPGEEKIVRIMSNAAVELAKIKVMTLNDCLN
jgi:beta-mannosidase